MTLYDDLGMAPDASQDELRRAYRGLARRLHPDLNGDPGTEERMRRINEAWAVLGEPASRRRYDRVLRETAGPPRPEPPPAGPSRWLRPPVLAVAVLAIIFVVTAYAGPHEGKPAPVPAAPGVTDGQPPSGLVSSGYVGQCLLVQTGYDAVVPCTQPNSGLVVGQTSRSADCPAATAVHQLVGRSQFVCLAGAGRQAPLTPP